MEVVFDRCCGLDVHKQTVVACLLTGSGRRARRVIRTFSTFSSSLEELVDWLLSEQCTHVGMESTGVYWMPIYTVLEGRGLELVVGNARHIRNVPGRKTDVKDAEWIAKLVRHGLISASFVPDASQRELRDFTRYRKALVQDRTGQRNRLSKLLEQANIKLGSVVSDVFGKSGWAMLEAIVADDRSAEDIADLARGRLRSKRPELLLALDGRVREHHRRLLKLQMEALADIDRRIAAVEQDIDRLVATHAESKALLETIPGIGPTVAAAVLAEVGPNVDAFRSEAALAAWAGLCPGNNESAGKTVGNRKRRGNTHLKAMLTEAAHAAIRVRDTYFRAKFFRLKARRGYRRALLAIAHKIIRAIYIVLSRREDFVDLGETYLDQLAQKRLVRQSVRRLEALGFEVKLEERPA